MYNIGYRVKWENNECKKPSNYFCSTHNKVLWNRCSALIHSICEWYEIPKKEDVEERLESIRCLLRLTKKTADNLNANDHIKDFNDRFGHYFNKLTEIDRRVSTQ